MTTTNTDYNKSIILTISLLEKEYDNTLIQYQQASQNYINDLKSIQTTKAYNILNGRTFWGDAGIKQFSAGDINECKASCSSISNCSGATFNSTNKNCWLRSGNGDIMTGTSTDNAIIPSIIQSSNILKKLNSKLIDINTKIKDVINQSYSDYTTQIDMRNKLEIQLQQNYQQLIMEKKHINDLIREYDTIDESKNNANINVNHYYLIYTVIILLALFCLLLFVYHYIKK